MMRHMFREGALGDYLIQGGKVKRPSKQRVTLAALQWAAERANMSYGQFTQQLKPGDEEQIQAEFEAWKAGRDMDRPHVGIEDTPHNDGEFVIGDADL